MIRKLLDYLNPIEHLGEKKYSIVFPILLTTFSAVALEYYAYNIVNDPMAVGMLAIVVFIALILYFAFRRGIPGGLAATLITISYYAYIMYSRKYTGKQLTEGVQTTVVLGLVYLVMAGIIGWLKQTIDTLIHREADEKRRLQAIIQQLPVGVIITDHTGLITEANKQLDQIIGRPIPLGIVVGKDVVIEAKHDGKPVPISEGPLSQVLRTSKAVDGLEYHIDRPDGEDVHLRVSAAPIHNRHGSLIAAACIISDITQQKLLEERKDDFVNMASHELRTPITSMKLYINSLISHSKKNEDEKAMKILENVKNQTERLQRLVSDLLDVSRLHTGKLSFTNESFQLDQLVEEIVDILQASSRNIKIILYENPSITIAGDRFRIYQVITNLINNAIKYSAENGEIHVKIVEHDGHAIISVQDFGIGIAKEQQEKIFDRLYQVSDKQSKTFPGLGMGLYIAKEIVTRHKGMISVESEKGKGSTFYVKLPLTDRQVQYE